jgi:hypothetical protein
MDALNESRWGMFSEPEHRGQDVKKASEYRKHAEECRNLARQVPEGPQREQLLEMARTWDSLANDRDNLIQKHPEIALVDKQDED